MKKLFFIIVAISLVWQFIGRDDSVVLGPGVKVSEAPIQALLDTPNVVQHNGFNLTQVASFKLQAKVLAIEKYYADKGSSISPVDLALGWGPMSNESVLQEIEIRQSNRFYWWRTDDFPIPRRDIETNSANMHIIPATDRVADEVEQIRVGDLIELSGYLVNASSTTENWYWQSSLTRNDTGNGACELIWVQQLKILTSAID